VGAIDIVAIKSLRDEPSAFAEIKKAGGRRQRPWTTEEDALLGTEPDATLASRFHRAILSVRQRRLALGRSVISKRAPDWTDAELKVLGTIRMRKPHGFSIAQSML
jgi:hypothetical protein